MTRTLAWKLRDGDLEPVLVLDGDELDRDTRVTLPAGAIADLAARAMHAALLSDPDRAADLGDDLR